MGAVLDKKRLRTIVTAVFGVFTTVVPYLLALHSAYNNAAPVFGRMDNSTTIYAYCATPATYRYGAALCESMWMEPASVHSEVESMALMQLSGYKDDIQIWLGATKKAHAWEWEDKSAWDYDPKDLAIDGGSEYTRPTKSLRRTRSPLYREPL
jgi:hypothetical protein